MTTITLIRELQYGGRDRVHRKVLAKVSLGLTSEALHAEDFNLQSMDLVHASTTDPSAGTVSVTRGSVINAYLTRPGSFKSDGNLASIQGIGLTNAANGTAAMAILSGSITVLVGVEGW